MLCYTTSDRCVSSSCTFPDVTGFTPLTERALTSRRGSELVEELTVSMINYFDEVCLQFSITSLCPSNWKNAFEVNSCCVYMNSWSKHSPIISTSVQYILRSQQLQGYVFGSPSQFYVLYFSVPTQWCWFVDLFPTYHRQSDPLWIQRVELHTIAFLVFTATFFSL